MAIKEPRKFVTTDQGHADVLNVPIDTLYENDQVLAAQIENIKNDPAGNDIASKAALDNHISDTNLHVTAAKQATWNAAEGNAKKYTEQYAAPKAHTHPASDLPSASTQARGIVQINTSVSSTATDQAAAPIAVKTANDRANEAYNLAQQSLTQAVDLKNKIVGAINGKFGGASSDMSSDQIAAAITNAPVKRFASGTFNGQSATSIGISSGADLSLAASGLGFSPNGIFFRVELRDTSNRIYLSGTVYDVRSFGRQALEDGSFNNRINSPYLTPQNGGFVVNVSSGSLRTGGGGSQAVLKAFEWWAFE
ncbi:tail fiber protein [Paenibacillus sp. EKM206P]|uniref:phage tail protein n=1 Tax=Paenibacillus sp. EKM206P TaxID=1683674 RepID=UPI0013E9DB41|nr:phage tail protein [Paenibacillus sp. EKM206P]KAF6569111.1 tail fiber protein [Paenibacillus sp. EKM206P]